MSIRGSATKNRGATACVCTPVRWNAWRVAESTSTGQSVSPPARLAMLLKLTAEAYLTEHQRCTIQAGRGRSRCIWSGNFGFGRRFWSDDDFAAHYGAGTSTSVAAVTSVATMATVASVAAMASMTAVTTMATPATEQAVAAVATMTAVTTIASVTAVTRTRASVAAVASIATMTSMTTVTAMSGHRLVVRSDHGNADDRKEQRDS